MRGLESLKTIRDQGICEMIGLQLLNWLRLIDERSENVHSATLSGFRLKNQHLVTVFLLALLAFLAILYFAWPVWRAQWPMEIDRNEAWNAFQVDRLRAGLALYPNADALIANNYPPLSFILIAGLSKFGINPIFVGRVLSLLATLAAALGIGAIVRLLNCGWSAAALGSFWYLATMSRFFDTYVGMNDPNLVGVAVMIWGLAWALSVRSHGGAIELPFALMAIAGFYKHTLFAVPATALLWLLMVDRRLAFRAALAGGIVVTAGFSMCLGFYGRDFMDQLTAPRVINIHRLISGLGRTQWIIPALLMWVYWAYINRKTRQAQFTALLVAMSIFDHALQQIGDGVDDNSQFELVAALAIGVALAYDYSASLRYLRISAGGTRVAILAILIFRLLLSNRIEPYLLVASETFRQIGPVSAAVVEEEIRRIAEIPGEVSCSIMTVCHYAGKQFVFDKFSVQQRIALGRLSFESVESLSVKNRIIFETIDSLSDMRVFRDYSTVGRYSLRQ